MKRKGWFRLWVVASTIGVPAAAIWSFNDELSDQRWQDNITAQLCVDQEFNKPSHPDSVECGRKAGAFKTLFERKGITPARYWSENLAFWFAVDLAVTALLVGAALIVRWVVRGFRDGEHTAKI